MTEVDRVTEYETDVERLRSDAWRWRHLAADAAADLNRREREITRLKAQLAAAVSDEAAQRFRDALAPGYVVWHNGKRLSPEDTLTQIKRGLIAALGNG